MTSDVTALSMAKRFALITHRFLEFDRLFGEEDQPGSALMARKMEKVGPDQKQRFTGGQERGRGHARGREDGGAGLERPRVRGRTRGRSGEGDGGGGGEVMVADAFQDMFRDRKRLREMNRKRKIRSPLEEPKPELFEEYLKTVDIHLVERGMAFKPAKSVEFGKTDQSMLNHIRNGILFLLRFNEALEKLSCKAA